MNVTKSDDIARIQLSQISDSTKFAYWVSWKKEYCTETPFTKYSIKETDFRVKTATFTSPSYIDLTTGLRIVRIVSKYHENFAGVVLDSSYDEDTGLYEYQCQDFSRLYMGKLEGVFTKKRLYNILVFLLTRGILSTNKTPTKKQLKDYRQVLSGLQALRVYDQSNYPGNIYKGNPFSQNANIIVRDKTFIEAIRDIVYSSLGFFDVWINDNGVLQIEPLSKTDWESTGLQLHAFDLLERKFKFSTTNAITGVIVNGEGLSGGKAYTAEGLVGLDLAAFFGRVESSVANPIKKTNATKSTSKTTTNTKGNPYGSKAKKIWIGADSGSGGFTQEVISYLNKAGWSCHYSGEGPNVHYEDYFNVTSDYQVLAIVDNGFDPATVMEPYEGSIKNELANKGVVCMFFFDTRDWTNPDGMKPYRYGNFKGYYAHRAWDDNYSNFSGSLNVDQYFRNNKIKYCANPSAKGMVDQFVAGGYYAYNNIKV